jgi:hypothetical protein
MPQQAAGAASNHRFMKGSSLTTQSRSTEPIVDPRSEFRYSFRPSLVVQRDDCDQLDEQDPDQRPTDLRELAV